MRQTRVARITWASAASAAAWASSRPRARLRVGDVRLEHGYACFEGGHLRLELSVVLLESLNARLLGYCLVAPVTNLPVRSTSWPCASTVLAKPPQFPLSPDVG